MNRGNGTVIEQPKTERTAKGREETDMVTKGTTPHPDSEWLWGGKETRNRFLYPFAQKKIQV